MIAVIFEVRPSKAAADEYLKIAAQLFDRLQSFEGFLSVERFQSLSDQSKLLSLSFWKDEQAVAAWRRDADHGRAQIRGRETIFEDYRICVAAVIRDYAMNDRNEAPE